MRYKNRYSDKQKQLAYMNACDCIIYGYSKSNWNSCGLDEDTAKKVWDCAYIDICNDF